MLKGISFSFIAFIFISFLACDSTPSGTEIKATVDGSGNLQAYLDQFGMNNRNQVIQKVDIDKNGQFEFETEEKLPQGIYRIRIGSQRFYLFLDGAEPSIEIKGQLTEMSKGNFEIIGSPATAAYNEVFNNYINRKYSTIPQLKEAVRGIEDPLPAFHMAFQAFRNDYTHLDIYEDLETKMAAAYPDTDYSKTVSGIVSSLQMQKQQEAMKAKIKVGEPAPDITLPDPDGKEYSLSDLKGQVVLLDFWASWCRPCRQENPNVVRVYNKYNNQGFTVFSVSLDRPNGKNAWIKAIEQDGLKWPHHVSDLKYWNSAPAKMYGVSSIPRTFLIDQNGIISAINPRGSKLEPAVQKLLQSS